MEFINTLFCFTLFKVEWGVLKRISIVVYVVYKLFWMRSYLNILIRPSSICIFKAVISILMLPAAVVVHLVVSPTKASSNPRYRPILWWQLPPIIVAIIYIILFLVPHKNTVDPPLVG